jgi:hypothetical protein
MGFLSKFFGGDSASSVPPSDRNSSAKPTSDAPAVSVEEVELDDSELTLPLVKAPAPMRVPVETVVAKPIDLALHEPKTEGKVEPKAKAPQPPFPLPGGPKSHAPLTPPPRTPAPRAATLIGIEAPTTGRYRLSATDTSDEVPASDARTQKVIINTGGDGAPKARAEVPTANLGPRQTAPKTAVRVGAKSKSVAELWREPLGEETTNPGVGHHAVAKPLPRSAELPRAELKLLADFAVQLSLGPVSGLWLMEAKPAVAVLKSAAAELAQKDIVAAIERLEPALATAPSRRIEGEARKELLDKLRELEPWLPTAKDIASEKTGRERLILDQLIAQISGLHPSSRRRLEDRGYASLDRLRATSPDVLVQELDLSQQHAEGLLAAFNSYYDERIERPPVLGRGLERCMSDAVTALERSAHEFAQACDGDDSERKRMARKQRAQAIANLNLLLAELGENELLDQMVRCSVQERVERLRQWLDTTSLGSQTSV